MKEVWYRWFRIGVLVICLGIMLCVWPFCLIRRIQDIYPRLDGSFAAAGERISQEAALEQSFCAQAGYLDSISIDVGYDAQEPEGYLHFELLTENGKCLSEKEIRLSEMTSRTYYEIPVKKWIRKGETYCIRLTADRACAGLAYGIYTSVPGEHAPGSLQLTMGGESIDGQAAVWYRYGYPLNIKNVACIWAFLATICITVWGGEISLRLRRFPGDGRLCRFWQDKGRGWAEKCKWILFAAEILGITALLAYLCGNRAVDWDEAYTYNLVTGNSFAGMLRQTAGDIHPPLYYIYVKLATLLFGTDLLVFKLCSVSCTVWVMLLGVTLVRKRWGNRVAFLFIMAAGLGPQFVFYAVYVRMYSMELFFVTLCGLLAYEIWTENKRWQWILFTASALGGAYTHYFAIVPLAVIYGFLMAGLIWKNRKAIRRFAGCCVCTVLGYLPWLGVMLRSFQGNGTTGEINLNQFDLAGLFRNIFSTNIEFSVAMPVLLLALSILLIFVDRKKRKWTEFLFLLLCGLAWFVTYVICLLIASMSRHFWTDRYVFGILGLLWLFMIIAVVRHCRAAFYSLAVWLFVMVMSAFMIQRQVELGTVEYIDQSYQVLEQVRDETQLLFNFPTYDMVWSFHMPDKEFIYIDDVDFDEIGGNYIYMIWWGARGFPDEVLEKYHIQMTDCGVMRFEEGMAGVHLYRVGFQRK